MKIAIVHDSLVEFGGAERVLLAMLATFPSADLYTSVADRPLAQKYFSSHRIVTLPIPQSYFYHHTSLFQIMAPVIWKTLNFEGYDLVIASAGHLMANLVHVEKPVFVQYIHSPPKNIFSLEDPTPLQRAIPYAPFIKRAYIHALHAARGIMTNSLHTQDTIQAIGGMSSVCIYPPVSIPRRPPKKKQGDYFFIVSRLDRSKSIELAIEACNKLGEHLYIVGVSNEPAYERYLHQIAGPTIKFVGFQPDERLDEYYAHAKAFLFTPKNEDFGIAPVEAMAHGVPVVAYYGGGAKETVTEGETGVFFRQHSSAALIKALRRFHWQDYDASLLYARAKQLDKRIFQRELRKVVSEVLQQRNIPIRR